MAIFTVTYTKNFKGKKEFLSKEVEADTFRKAQNMVKRECQGELCAYFLKWQESNPDKGYRYKPGAAKKFGLWNVRNEVRVDKKGHAEPLTGSAILVFSDFSAVPKE